MPSLAPALETALAAAREAAALLRAEFHRAGGPRGEIGHCPADEEAEDLVRERILAAFPEHGFQGEERPDADRAPRDAAGSLWIVDPNDGTADFQRGRRGAAVSIALVSGGLPVLGVVLAHTSPEGGEDLFAWAEGEGPLRRNGAATGPLADGPLAAGDVVLVSSGAPRHALEMARALAPARPRPMTSIAYRLALAAAGAARAGISLHEPRGLDVAAGHALLRGAGGVLVDERGREVRYGGGGRERVRVALGGAPSVAAELARRDLVGAVAGPGQPVRLARAAPGAGIQDAGLLRRGQGALLGLLAGDALGSQVEFLGPREIAARFPDGVRTLAPGGTWQTLAGQPTDDGELALALARSLVDAGGFDAGAVAAAYAAWLASEPFDVGGTTRAALGPAAEALARGEGRGAVAAAARAGARPESLANGALMRVGPLGILGHAAPPDALAAWARADAALTHPNPICGDASAVFALAVADAIATGAPAAEIADRAERRAEALGAAAPVREALAAARAGRAPDFLLHEGLVTVALQNAFLRLRSAPSLEEGLVATVGAGGDTDTNAAIAGALLGAVHGVGAVPARWASAVLSCFPAAGAPQVKRARPSASWPVDALVLAERLLSVGSGAIR